MTSEKVYRCGCSRQGWAIGPTYHHTGIMWAEEEWPHYATRESARQELAARMRMREEAREAMRRAEEG